MDNVVIALKLITAVVTCTTSSHYSRVDWGGAHKVPPVADKLWQLMAAGVRENWEYFSVLSKCIKDIKERPRRCGLQP